MSSGALTGNVKGWLAKPFTEDMDTMHWFLFIGLVAVIVIIWTRILKTLEI